MPLGYGEPQVLEVFKNILPTKLYWILFPIEDLRQVVETARRLQTKEKLDKQLTGQTSTSSVMNIRNGTERKVSFNARDKLGDKKVKLTVLMSRLAAKDSSEKRPFKPQIYKSRGSYPQSQNRSYNQRSYQNRSGRSDGRNRGQYGSNRPRQNYRHKNFQENTRGCGGQDSRGNNYNRSRDRMRERTLSRNYGNNRDRSSSNSR